jgi:cobalt-zinc-cadmium efflux system outer membrane protein
VVLLGLVTGCATFDPQAGFPEVSAAVAERSGRQVVWNVGTDLDAQVTQEIHTLLVNTLTADAAVQVALLNNRELQALYAELGVAQADVVQAGLLRNPLFDGAAKFPLTGGQPDLELGMAINFLHVFSIPLRKRVAAAGFEEAKLHVTGAVLDFAASVRTAFYRHQANEQLLELQQTIVQALAVSLEVTRRLHAAGNITDLDLARERALTEEVKVQLRATEMAERQSREQLNSLMGLWGEETAWHSDRRLPDLPEPPVPLADLERQALRRSLDLARARQQMIVAGEQLGLNRTTALVPESHIGALAERQEGAWEVGPTLEFPIPLFDQGQARVGRAWTELRRAQQTHYALGVEIRSVARALRDRLQGDQDRAQYYRDILLPLRERIVNATQLQYNAMQIGPVDLLRAREQQIQAAVAYVETLRDYWVTRTNLGQLLSGRLPRANEFAAGRREQPATAADNGGH